MLGRSSPVEGKPAEGEKGRGGDIAFDVLDRSGGHREWIVDLLDI